MLVPLYDSGYYGIPALRDALVQAGSPRLNDGWRSKQSQQIAHDTLGGWDPNNERLPREHMRGIAADIAEINPARLRAAGLVQTVAGESWHWALPNWQAYPIIPTLVLFNNPVGTNQEEEEMLIIVCMTDGTGDGAWLKKGVALADSFTSPLAVLTPDELGALEYYKNEKGIPYRRAEWDAPFILQLIKSRGVRPQTGWENKTDYTSTAY